MTRKIPWRDGPSVKPASYGSPSRITSSPFSSLKKRVKAENGDKDSDVDSRTSTSSPFSKYKANKPTLKRIRSNSQPPEPLQEVFMRNGLTEDDAFRMVEDEFYLIANRFTAHLHAAEYQRLQVEAKSQNATKIKNISRPVVGRMTDLVKKKQDRASRTHRQQSALAKNNGSSNDEDNDTLTSTSLFGLMESPRKKVPRLDHFANGNTITRVSTMSVSRLSKNSSNPRRPSEEPSSNEDDLEVMPPPKLSKPIVRAPVTSISASRAPATDTYNTSRPASPQHLLKRASPQTQQVRTSGTDEELSDDDSDDALFSFQKRAKSRALQKQKNTPSSNVLQAKPNRDIIPGFN